MVQKTKHTPTGDLGRLHVDLRIKKRLKLLGLLAGIIVLVFALIGISSFLNRRGKTAVEIFVLPTYSEVSINGKDGGSGVKYLSPGEYTISVSADGFSKQERKITVTTDRSTEDFILTPESEEAKSWVRRNESKYQEFEARSGQETQQEGDVFRKNNPIVAFLPYRSLYFNVDYKKEGNDAVVLVSANTPAGRSFAIEQLKDWGISPSSYKVEFVDLKSPWESL